MAIIFRYAHVPRPDGTLRDAPYIPVLVRHRSGRMVRVLALIDSGADTTVVPKDLALALGLHERSPPEETGGIGGKVPVRRAQLSIQIHGGRERHSLTLPVLVLQDENADLPLLLGRHGFFEEFHITFKQEQQKIMLKKVTPLRSYR